MPANNTKRKDKLVELLKLAQNGPAFSHIGPGAADPYTPELAVAAFKRWSGSWLLPIVQELHDEHMAKLNRCRTAAE